MDDKQKALLMLTKEWQNVALYEWNHSSGAKCTFYVDAKLSTDQSIVENKSLVDIRLRSVLGSYSSLSGSGYKFTCTNCPIVEGTGVWYFATETITSISSKEIIHEDDGTKQLPITATLYNGYLGLNQTISATVQLPTIARKSSISCVSPFNIGDNVTLNINSKSASFKHTIRYNFENVGERIIAENITGGTNIQYPWTTPSTMFTDGNMENKPNGNGYLTVETFANGVSIGISNQFPFTANVPNNPPDITASIIDSNNNIVQNYTGNNSILVKGLSNAQISATVTPKNSASISNYKIMCSDGKSTTSYPVATLNGVGSGTFNITATDTRGFTKTITKTNTFKDYFEPYAVETNIRRTEQTSKEIIATLSGKWWNNNFGIKQNTLKYSYRTRVSGGTWSSWSTDTTPIISGNNFTITNLSLGSNYDTNKAYDIQFRLKDEVNYYELNSQQVTVSIPIIEVYDDEVAIYGNGYIQDELVVGDIKSSNLFNKYLYSYDYVVANDIGGVNYYYAAKIYLGEPNTEYYLHTEYINDYSSVGVSNMYVLLLSEIGGNWLSIGHTTSGAVDGVLTSDSDGYVYIQIYKNLSKANYENLIKNSNIQIKKGSTLAPYTPYKAYGIVESGSNSNGEWVKYDDGTMECRNSFIEIPANIEYKEITFPQNFINRNISVGLTPFYSYYKGAILTISKPQTSYFNIYPLTHAGAIPTQITGFSYIAIGRWK